MSKDNLTTSDFDGDAAGAESTEEVLHRLYVTLVKRADEAADWYFNRKDSYKKWSKRLLFLAIVVSTLGLLVPVLITVSIDQVGGDGTGGHILTLVWWTNVSPTWGLLAAGLAAAFIGIDRFMGISTGWVRYVQTGLLLHHRREQFVTEWWTLQSCLPLAKAERLPEDLPVQPDEWTGGGVARTRTLDMPGTFIDSPPDGFAPSPPSPTSPPFPGIHSPSQTPTSPPDSEVRESEFTLCESEKVAFYIDLLQQFDEDVRLIIRNETDQWVQEFQNNLQALSRRINEVGKRPPTRPSTRRRNQSASNDPDVNNS